MISLKTLSDQGQNITSKHILAQINCFRSFANTTLRQMKKPIEDIWMPIVKPYPYIVKKKLQVNLFLREEDVVS
jgi:hypothetical protein